MGVNYAELSNGETLFDTRGLSVNPDVLGEGETAIDSAGNIIEGKAKFGNSKIVTETVYPLSSKENYTGVEVLCYDGEVLVDGVTFTKVADNVYEPSELIGKRWTFDDSSGEIDFRRYISENGSFETNNSFGVVVVAEDVGKQLNIGDLDSTFPEPGTYLGNDTEFFVAGTYKREVEAHDFDVIVEGALNPLNLSVESLNKNYAEIAEALNLKKDVRLLLSVPMGADNVMTVLGTVETFRPNEGMIEFGVIIDTTLSQDDGEQVYHFRITLWEDDSVSTERKVLSSDNSGGEAVSPTVEVTQIENGHRVTITDVNGSESFDVMNGEKGDKGDTPQKGTDYWTASDKQEIVTDVLNALPTWNGGSY